jgi:hypothetical protein
MYKSISTMESQIVNYSKDICCICGNFVYVNYCLSYHYFNFSDFFTLPIYHKTQERTKTIFIPGRSVIVINI